MNFPAEFSEGQRAIIRQIAGEVRTANKADDKRDVDAAIQTHHESCPGAKLVTVWQVIAALIAIAGTAATVYAVMRNMPCK